MKKTISVIFALVFVISLVFAQGATDDGSYAGVTNKGYRPSDSNYYDGLNYSLFRNPSDFATDRLRIQGVLGSSSFNFSDALQNRSVAESFSHLTKFHWDKKNWINYVLGLATEVGSGNNDIISADFSVGAQVGNYGFGINVTVDAKSMPMIDENAGAGQNNNSILGNGYLPVVDAALSFGYGRRVVDTSSLTFDVGATIHFSEKLYMLQLNLDTAADIINKTRGFENLQTRSGLAMPLDIAATFGFMDQRLTVSAMLNNINGYYYMRTYDNIGDAASFNHGYGRYLLYTPWTFSTSVVYNPRLGNYNPVMALEFTDINLFFRNELEKESPMLEFFKYVNASVKFDIHNIVSLKAAYKYGYPEFGLSVAYRGNQIDFIYGFHEAGSVYGEKPVDSLTFRMKFGVDK